MYIIGMVILTFFAVIGAAAFITGLLRAKDADEDIAVILYKLNEDDAEARIRKAAELCGEIRCERLICVCEDIAAKNICVRMKKVYPIVEISDKKAAAEG